MPYLWYKSFHIVGFTVWFAGLFYLVRLFVYHALARKKDARKKKDFRQLLLKTTYGF
jgi:protoporphyrinogen IX oxidase